MPSTVIKNFSYDEKASILRITFLSEHTYEYYAVSPEIYVLMKSAFSKGTFFNECIKGNYKFKKLHH